MFMENVVLEQPFENIFFAKESSLPPLTTELRRYNETTSHGNDVPLLVLIYFDRRYFLRNKMTTFKKQKADKQDTELY